MITRGMLKEYLKYIVPTMITFTLVGVYSIIDGVFVGHAVGDAGLAGINVAFPLVAFIMAVGTGVGMGGGVISSIARGAGNEAKARRAMGTTLTMLALSAVPIMALLFTLATPICELLGGQGETLAQAAAYTGVIAWGVPFQILVTGCTPLIRNQGKVAYAMAVQVFAGLMNVALDYVFVILLGMGTAGAAAATVVSQVSAFLLVLGFFLKRENRIAVADLRPDRHIALHALRLGLAPFGLTLLPEATVVAINVNLSMYGGEQALAAYAVVSYTACVIQMLIQGVGDGSQPLDLQALRRGRRRRRAPLPQHELPDHHQPGRVGVGGHVLAAESGAAAVRGDPTRRRGSSRTRCPSSPPRTCSTGSPMRPLRISTRWTTRRRRAPSCTARRCWSFSSCSARRACSGSTASGCR